jgi:outer membrane protein assembly factor BamA
LLPPANHKRIDNEICFPTLLYNSPVSRFLRRSLVAFLIFCIELCAQNSTKPKLSYKLLSIHVTGLNHFKEDQVIAASGLKLGDLAGEKQFEQAAQKLGETGLFSNLSYKYQYSTAGCDLDMQVAENDQLVPITFDNFVWFSDDELLGLLHSKLPLFEGRVPTAGKLADQVAGALKQILDERKIFGEAEYHPAGALNGPITSYLYQVSLHPVLVRNVEFAGAANGELPALQAAAKALPGQDYTRTKMRVQEEKNLLPVYLSRGYLKAQFSDSQAKVAEDGTETKVDVTFPVLPGVQYKLVNIEWEGNSVFPVEKLQTLIHLKAGEPANAVQLTEDLEEIRKLYGTKGYLFAHADPTPEMDDSAATVSYQLSMTESDQYRMGELTIDGIPAANAAKMAEQWQLKKRDPFDDSYMQRFFKIMYHDVGLNVPYNIVSKQNVNQKDKTVSVVLHFVPK